jgi:hypothetical protein
MHFLYRIMGAGPDASDQEIERANRLVNYLQKCFGYALTGDVTEEAVFCFFGSGNNGKTTLLETIRFILSEYSTQVLIDTLMQHHSRESNASLADLGEPPVPASVWRSQQYNALTLGGAGASVNYTRIIQLGLRVYF